MIDTIKKNNRGPVQYRKRKLSGSGFPGSETLRRSDSSRSMLRKSQSSTTGFVILFAVMLSSILLSIALGVANIALKEVKFGTNARDTNNAFLAADTGIEFVLFKDKPPSSYGSVPMTQDEVVPNLGITGESCAKVNVTKTNIVINGVTYLKTAITSKGYNIGSPSCNSTNPDRIERELIINY